MAKNKLKFKRPATDVMTHAAIALTVSILFFVLNYYFQTIAGYTLADPQIYQFLLAPLFWAVGLGIHAWAGIALNRLAPANEVQRSLRHKLRDIHIGVFAAFFTMLVSLGLAAEVAGTGELNLGTVLIYLGLWAVFVGGQAWIVRLSDERDSLLKIIHKESRISEERYVDVSRLIEMHEDDDDSPEFSENHQSDKG
jgi:hypothetical protein